MDCTYFNYTHRLITLRRVKCGVEYQTEAFLDRFNDIVPVNWLQFFDERELELMLCGMQELNVDEWGKHTAYKGGYSRDCKHIELFWQVKM